jgi:large subunit ribosomal protein L13
MKTFSPRPRDIERKWYVVDADGVVLGRLATHVATILRGKHKPIFAPHADTGDHVIVVNARGVRVTGNKEQDKMYYRHSGYPGGLREEPYWKLMAQRPTRVVEEAIRGMLPKNRLGRDMFRKLSVYEGTEHPHGAQKPVLLERGQFPKWEGLPEPTALEAKPAPRPVPEPSRPRAARPARGEAPEKPGRAKTAGRSATSIPRAATTRRTPTRKATTAKSTAKSTVRSGSTGRSTGRSKTASTTRRTSSGKAAAPKRTSRRSKKES